MAAETDIGRGESPQVRTLAVVLAVAVILGLLALIAFGLQMVFPDRVGITSVIRRPFPAPAVVPDERARRLSLDAEQQRLLDGGQGRMPIEAAMQAIAAKGQKAFDPVGGGP